MGGKRHACTWQCRFVPRHLLFIYSPSLTPLPPLLPYLPTLVIPDSLPLFILTLFIPIWCYLFLAPCPVPCCAPYCNSIYSSSPYIVLLIYPLYLAVGPSPSPTFPLLLFIVVLLLPQIGLGFGSFCLVGSFWFSSLHTCLFLDFVYLFFFFCLSFSLTLFFSLFALSSISQPQPPPLPHLPTNAFCVDLYSLQHVCFLLLMPLPHILCSHRKLAALLLPPHHAVPVPCLPFALPLPHLPPHSATPCFVFTTFVPCCLCVPVTIVSITHPIV